MSMHGWFLPQCRDSAEVFTTMRWRDAGARMTASKEIGTSEQVQDVGRGTLMATAEGSDVVQEVSGKVQGLYDVYPYPPEAVFDGVTVGYNHRWSWTHAWSAIHGEAPKTNAIDILDAGWCAFLPIRVAWCGHAGATVLASLPLAEAKCKCCQRAPAKGVEYGLAVGLA